MEISESKYESLVADANEAKSLRSEVNSLKEEAKNKKIALEQEREKRKAFKSELDEVKASKEELETKLSENEEKYKDFEAIEWKATKWDEYETKLLEDREKNISEMKEKLGEDWLKENESFLEWLSDEKVETFLKRETSSLDKNWENLPPKPNNDGMGWKPWSQNLSKFDEAIQKEDVNAALDNIPLPE